MQRTITQMRLNKTESLLRERLVSGLEGDEKAYLIFLKDLSTHLRAFFRKRLTQLPDEERGRYNTLAGLLLAMAGRLLTEGEHIACAGWVFEVVDLDGRRIDKVWARPIVESERVSA